MGYVYKITNTVNGKAYIGKTINLDKRISAHLNCTSRGSRLVKRAIEKYGRESFVYEILHDGIIPGLLGGYEMELIKKHNSKAPHGYNLTDGGEGAIGCIPSVESRRKMSEARKGEKNPNYGKSPSKETRKKLSEAFIGRNLSKETCEKMRKSMLGKNRHPQWQEAHDYFLSLPRFHITNRKT